jgi:hypothetical protein
VYEEKIPATDTEVAKTKKHHVAKEWLQWPGRSKAPAYVYEPGKARILPEGVNDWNGWGVAPEYVKKGSVALWNELLDHQFSNVSDAERRWVEQWFAYPLQNPGAKMPTAILNWGIVQGTGKDLLARTLGTIYGENAVMLKESDVDSSHNELFEHKQFITFEELSGGTNNRRVVGDSFKRLITQSRVNINPKFLRPYSIKDCINYYVTSNHSDPLYLEPTDRRWFVNQVTNGRVEGDFYERYMEHFGVGLYENAPKPENVGVLLYHFLNISLEGFDVTAPAPATNAKRALIALSTNDPALWAATLRDDPDSALLYDGAIVKISLATESDLLAIFKRRFPDENRSRMQRAIAEAGISQVNRGEQVRGCGDWGKPHLYAVRDRDALLNMKEKDLAKRFIQERQRVIVPFNQPIKGRF